MDSDRFILLALGALVVTGLYASGMLSSLFSSSSSYSGETFEATGFTVADGQRCGTHIDCSDQSWCGWSNAGYNMCKRKMASGEYCADAHECQSGNCAPIPGNAYVKQCAAAQAPPPSPPPAQQQAAPARAQQPAAPPRSNLRVNEFCNANNECQSGYCDTARPGGTAGLGRCGTPPSRNMRVSGEFCTADNDCKAPYLCRPMRRTEQNTDACMNIGLASDMCRANNDCLSGECTNKDARGIGACKAPAVKTTRPSMIADFGKPIERNNPMYGRISGNTENKMLYGAGAATFPQQGTGNYYHALSLPGVDNLDEFYKNGACTQFGLTKKNAQFCEYSAGNVKKTVGRYAVVGFPKQLVAAKSIEVDVKRDMSGYASQNGDTGFHIFYLTSDGMKWAKYCVFEVGAVATMDSRRASKKTSMTCTAELANNPAVHMVMIARANSGKDKPTPFVSDVRVKHLG